MSEMKTYILDRCTPEPNTGCWLWDMSLDQDGYGRAKFKEIKTPAHRISYMAFNGPLMDLNVLHKCDTRACVNPDHLWLGTAKDNMQDCLKKGRKQTVYNPFSKKILKTHCINGHKFDDNNIYFKKYGEKISIVCKLCVKHQRQLTGYREKQKAALRKRNTQEYKDKMAAKKRAYNANRKEHLKELRRQYRLKNLEKIRAYEREQNKRKRERLLNAKPD